MSSGARQPAPASSWSNTAPTRRSATCWPRRHTDLTEQELAAETQASLDLIDCALDCDHDDFTQCPQFQAVVSDRIGIDTSVHVPG